WRHFQGDVILWAVRWYCRYPISYRDLEEMLAERGISVDHTTIYRWPPLRPPISALASSFGRPSRGQPVGKSSQFLHTGNHAACAATVSARRNSPLSPKRARTRKRPAARR